MRISGLTYSFERSDCFHLMGADIGMALRSSGDLDLPSARARSKCNANDGNPKITLLLVFELRRILRSTHELYTRDVAHPALPSNNLHTFVKLGPGRPSAGGPRMDRRAVTSLEVVKISRLVSRLPSIDSMTNQRCMKQ